MGKHEEPNEPEDGEDFESSDSGVRSRVNLIAQRMQRLEWRKSMIRELADEWCVSKSTVRNYSAEASRIVGSSIPTGPEFKAGIVEATLRIFGQAEQSASWKDAIGALRLVAELGGHMAPTKTKSELSGPDGGPIQTRACVVELPPLDAGKDD